MKNICFVAMAILVLALTGCGSDGVVVSVNPPPVVVSHILSDALLDGDIEVSTGLTVIRQSVTQSVFVGLDPLSLTETRAFLDFSLSSIPGNAIINSATLDFVVDSINPSSAVVPMLVDLVSFSQPLLAVDFVRAFLVTTPIVPPIAFADIGNHVSVDVTSLMQEAQRQGLSHFQVRLLKGSGGTSVGVVEINDTTGPNRALRAPQLTVIYL